MVPYISGGLKLGQSDCFALSSFPDGKRIGMNRVFLKKIIFVTDFAGIK